MRHPHKKADGVLPSPPIMANLPNFSAKNVRRTPSQENVELSIEMGPATVRNSLNRLSTGKKAAGGKKSLLKASRSRDVDKAAKGDNKDNLQEIIQNSGVYSDLVDKIKTAILHSYHSTVNRNNSGMLQVHFVLRLLLL